MDVLEKNNVFIKNFLGMGFDIYWYGVLIAIGFVVAYGMCVFFARKRGYPKDLPSDMLILAILGALVGARLYYVVFEWHNYYVQGDLWATFLRIIDVREGGLAIYGGVIGGVLLLFAYSRRKKMSLWQLTDLAAAGLAFGQGLGRWGNFFNQEAHGLPVENPSLQFFPYAVYIDAPKDGEAVGWYQATFFYESVWCLLLCGLLVWLFFRQRYHGQLTFTYFALYGLERGLVEWLRTDQLRIGPVPVSAILSIVLCLTFAMLLFFNRHKRIKMPTAEANEEPADKSADKPDGERADEPADEPVDEPADEPVEEPVQKEGNPEEKP